MILETSKTAHIEEILAYCILSKKLSAHKMIIGDDSLRQLPDISSQDGSIGIEVAVCERRGLYQQIKNKYIGLLNENKLSLDTVMPVIVKSKKNFKLSRNFLKKKRYCFYCEKSNIDIINQYKIIINKKLNNLNKGNYDGVKQKHLCIISNYEYKNLKIEVFAKIYCSLLKEYQRKFDSVFIILKNKVYNFHFNDKNNDIKREDISIKAVKQSFQEVNETLNR